MKSTNPVLTIFLNHVQTPLYRNAYAWLLSTGVSSALGLVYWVLAARLYLPAAVGVNAALISMMVFLAGISQLNLINALVRFIPNAGLKTASLTAYSYAICMLLALVASVIFVALVNPLTGLEFFKSNRNLAILFIPATMIWTVFNLQDSVLAGLRSTMWVPVDNITYGIVKIALLVALAPLSPGLGIYISWIIPALLLVPAINLLIFVRLIPRHVQATKDTSGPLHWPALSRFVGSNYAASLFSLTSSRLVPVLVVAVAGATAGAYFYMAWAIADSFRLASIQMTTSLTVEGARDQQQLAANAFKFLRLLVGLIVPLVAGLLFGAPILLRLSGHEYASQGVALLRWLGIALLPALVITWYLSIARILHRLADILLTEGILAILFLSLSYVLLLSYGVTGVGIASLISATMVAIALFPRLQSALLVAPSQKPKDLDTRSTM